MANEMRDRLVELLQASPYIDVLYGSQEEWEGAADYLLTNDVVPVVRCKDCKYYKAQKQSVNWKNKKKYCCRVVALKVNENDYCSYGERRCE